MCHCFVNLFISRVHENTHPLPKKILDRDVSGNNWGKAGMEECVGGGIKQPFNQFQVSA